MAKAKSKVLQPKSEIAWQTFNDAIKKYHANLKRYQAETDSKAKERIQDTLRDDGLRLQTFFNEQTRYNTTNTPSAILNPKTGKAGGQWHHAATQNRILPFFLTVKNQKDFNRLIGALRQYGIATGNSYQNMFDLPIDLHASKNPRAIHRVEEKAGLDEPDRYFKQGGTIDDAIKAVPYLAEDVTGSKRLARDLQYGRMTIGEGSEFSDRVQMTATSESTPEHLKINQEGLQPDLSEQYHKRINKARQTSLKHVRDRQKGKLTSKTVTDANYNVTHGEQQLGPDGPPTRTGQQLQPERKQLQHLNIQNALNQIPNAIQMGMANGIPAAQTALRIKELSRLRDQYNKNPGIGNTLDYGLEIVDLIREVSEPLALVPASHPVTAALQAFGRGAVALQAPLNTIQLATEGTIQPMEQAFQENVTQPIQENVIQPVQEFVEQHTPEPIKDIQSRLQSIRDFANTLTK